MRPTLEDHLPVIQLQHHRQIAHFPSHNCGGKEGTLVNGMTSLVGWGHWCTPSCRCWDTGLFHVKPLVL